MSRSPVEFRDESRFPAVGRSPPQGLRKKYWSHDEPVHFGFSILDLGLKNGGRMSHREQSKIRNPKSKISRIVCRSLRAIPTSDGLGTTQAGRYRTTTRTPASLKGPLTRRILTFVSFVWLTNAIDRIVKDPRLPHSRPPMVSAGARLPLSNPPRPASKSLVFGREVRSTPTLLSLGEARREAKAMLTGKTRGSIPRSRIISKFGDPTVGTTRRYRSKPFEG